jgi:maltose alpha-D-glucosyltransferase/alpha-amylase
MLTEVAKFEHIAPYAGQIVYKAVDPETAIESSYVLALLQGQVKNVGDGWSWTLEQLQEIQTVAESDLIQRFESAIGLLGRRTAEMHSALEEAEGPDFLPETGSPEIFAREADKFKEQIAGTFSVLRQRFSELPEEYVADAASLFVKRQMIESVADQLAQLDVKEAGYWTRIHGDFHLGQVLRTEDDFVILDFEGEPVKSVEERRSRKSPLRDVAGMLRSFSYVVAVFHRDHPEAESRLKEREQIFQKLYLDSYLLSRSKELTATTRTMLKAYLLEKALYELEYELNHRPQWTDIPLRGILEILQDEWES